jgi:hypothetical protein
MGRKVIHISLPEEVYYKIKESARKEHLPLSTWVKQRLLKLLNGNKE